MLNLYVKFYKEPTAVHALKKSSNTVHVKPKKAIKQVTFQKETKELEDAMILTELFSPQVDTSAARKSSGHLFGKPQTSPVKQDIFREKTCHKKATWTIKTEKDDSVGVLCTDHAKSTPGTYKIKGIM